MIQTIEHLNPDTLSALIDRELPDGEQETIQQHLAGCHACALRVLSATGLKAATARAGRRFAPPPGTLARLTAQLHREPRGSLRIHSIRRVAWASLAAAMLLGVSLIGWRQPHETNTLAAELLDQHLATLSSAAIPQVISTDRHTVKPWFQGHLPFSFNLPDAQALPPDTTLKGADLTYLKGQPAALLLFTIHKHKVSVFLTQRSDGPSLTAPPSTRSGFTIHSATTQDLRIVAVSDVNPADLDALVATLVQAQSPS
jgi:anti-sigma factor RsiW